MAGKILKCGFCNFETLTEGLKNIVYCPHCSSELAEAEVSKGETCDDIRICPLLLLAESAGYSDEKIDNVFLEATRHQAYGIMYDARRLLEVFLANATTIDLDRVGLVAGVAEEIGRLGSALKTLEKVMSYRKK